MYPEDIFRCLDCLSTPTLCKQCMLEKHTLLPFHRIEIWKNHCFLPARLMDIGHVIHLGHNGQPCPANYALPDTVMCIIDTHGIYQHKVRQCGCSEAFPLHAQLFRMWMFPSSVERPQTAFTFSLLDYFRVDALECKTSANNFFNKLRRLTDNWFPESLPVSDTQDIFHFVTPSQLPFRTGIGSS